jgi:hypothetical protein
MGIDASSLNDQILKRLDPSGRALVRAAIGRPNAGLTAEEASTKYLRKLERDEQKILVSWLNVQEEDGRLVFDWSRTDKKTTNRKGIPDFRIFRNGRALLGEMKLDGGKLSPEQQEMSDKFLRAGCWVQTWNSAADGIVAIQKWLMDVAK